MMYHGPTEMSTFVADVVQENQAGLGEAGPAVSRHEAGSLNATANYGPQPVIAVASHGAVPGAATIGAAMISIRRHSFLTILTL